MAIITLTSDWGTRDHYAAAVKGAILSRLPSASIVDISHQIERFNIFQASFTLKNCYRNFPPGTIHIIDILSESSPETPNTVVFCEEQYFIATDNGILTLIFDKKPIEIYEIDIMQDSDYFTFLARDLFAKTACHIAEGKPLSELGKPKGNLTEIMSFAPAIEKNVIKGQVIHVDSYQNAYVNITESLFREIGKARKFSIIFRAPSYSIEKISTSYSDVAESDMLALFSTNGFLEIAINRGNAGGLLNLSVGESVRIEFND
jgi:S-adenosyl-L-methionine hydrolase (adenosine-forming)